MTTRLRRRHILLTGGLALLLGACSGASTPAGIAAPSGAPAVPQQASGPTAPGPSSAAAAGTDPCALLTKAEVATAFGESMLEPVSTTAHGDTTCTYSHEAGGGDLIVTISSRSMNAAGIKSAEAIYGTGATDLPGIGDAAFEVAGILEFVKGTTLVTVGTGDGPAIISDANFQALAATAAGRI